jgi:hypothetical protein
VKGHYTASIRHGVTDRNAVIVIVDTVTSSNRTGALC